MRQPDPLRSRSAIETVIAALTIVFLAWFTMKFHMDNASDSETQAYVRDLIVSATQGTIAADSAGQYTALAPYVMWPISAGLEVVTGAYLIRGLVFALLFLSAAVYGAAYMWYRQVGLAWLTSLFGLMLLSTSLAFAMLLQGWEIDKLIEPALFLFAAIAAWNHRYLVLPVIAALAAANRESGLFVPLVALAGLAQPAGGLRSAIKQWPVWACVCICAVEVAVFRRFGPAPSVAPWESLTLDRLVYVIGGLCLLPVFAVAWIRAAPVTIRRLFYLVAPAWVVFVLGTDRLDQGAVLLTPLALLFVPVTLAGVEQVVRAPTRA